MNVRLIALSLTLTALMKCALVILVAGLFLEGCGGKDEPTLNDPSAEPAVTISEIVHVTNAVYTSTVIGDINQDGFDDVIAVGLKGETTVFINNQQGQLIELAGATKELGSVYKLADLNQDGKLDAVTKGGDGWLVALGHGDGTFGEPGPGLDFLSQNYTSVAFGYFNDDPVLDMVAANGQGAILFVADGTGGYTSQVISDRLGAVRVADVNADGVDDVLISGYYRLSLYIGNGDGTFKPPQFTDTEVISLGSSSERVHFGDVNGDGWLDIAFLSGATVHVMVNEHENGFTEVFNLGYPNDIDYDVDSFYLDSFALADMNCDGAEDIVLAEFVSSTVKVLVSNADGTFRRAVELDPNKKLARVASLDVNKDGAQDLFALPSGEVYTNQSCLP